MIKAFLVAYDQSSTISPIIIDSIAWETHRKGRAGTLQIAMLDSENLRCQMGDFIELYEVDKKSNDYRKILRYRIFDRIKKDKQIEIKAYDQLYYWIQSKESLLVSRADYDQIKEFERFYLHTLDPNCPAKQKEDELKHKIHIQERTYIKGKETDCVFPSDLILLFAKKYKLNLEYIDYSDIVVRNDDNIHIGQWGYHGRITKNEAPIDIIQSFIDFNTVNLRKMYFLYDGAHGICYRNIQDMRTYLMFTLAEIGGYSIHENLPKDYFNLVDFMIIDFDETDEDPHVDINKQTIETYLNIERIRQLGIFHNHEDITSKDIKIYKKDKSGKKVLKTVYEVLKDRKAYYKQMNETLPIQLTLNDVRGNWKVRGGSIIGIEIPTFDHLRIKIEVLVERITHNYQSESDHTMNIEVTRVV